MPRAIESVVESVRRSASYNPAALSAPACVLWPDKEKQWVPGIPDIRKELPELLTLDANYDPDTLTGPGIWIRCAIAGRLEGYSCPEGLVPVIYVPGFGRQDFRAVESCPGALKPLVELQFRGVFWSHPDTSDWTVHAFLTSEKYGLGLDIPESETTLEALKNNLPKLLFREVQSLSDRHLDVDYLIALDVPDPDSSVLKWLNDDKKFRADAEPGAWQSFVSFCKDSLGFNPEIDGPRVVVERLAEREGKWSKIWNRFKEAPNNYAGIIPYLEKLDPPKAGSGGRPLSPDILEAYPRWNSAQEDELRKALGKFKAATAGEARKKILKLEESHSPRREMVWARTGEAPLARALEHIAGALAACAEHPLKGGNAGDLEDGYVGGGWMADDGIVRALAELRKPSDIKAASKAIHSFYDSWLYDSAVRLQEMVIASGYPGKPGSDDSPDYRPGDCVLFVDGLRFDVAKRLSADLSLSGFTVSEKPVWAALPSVTATGKPAVSPVKELVSGELDSAEFMPCVRSSGKQLTTKALEELLTSKGWKVLEEVPEFDGQSRAWFESGNIDYMGHHVGAKLPQLLGDLVGDVYLCIKELFERGWKRVFVVTDHGWLFLPDGLPKVDLPGAVTMERWSRCASVKPGASTPHESYPWHWNSGCLIACAPGSACYIANKAYAHGGLSLQECLNLRLEVSRPDGIAQEAKTGISEFRWKGFACHVTVAGGTEGMSLVLRKKSTDASAIQGDVISKVDLVAFKSDGELIWQARLFFQDEKLEGNDAFLVLLDREGTLRDIRTVVLGVNR